MLGTKILIPKLYASSTEKLGLEIQPGTQPCTKIQIPNEGYIKLNCKKKRADLIVTILVEIPTQLSPEQRELFEQLVALDGILTLSTFVSKE